VKLPFLRDNATISGPMVKIKKTVANAILGRHFFKDPTEIAAIIKKTGEKRKRKAFDK
jgi:hypothetical protein